MKFLVVDDSSTMRRIITRALSDIEYDDYVEAKNGVDALTYIGEVDFILTDWNMPVMDGLQFVKKIRSKDKKIPIMMITTNADEESVIKAIKEGVSGYIIKPFTPESLMKKIERILNKLNQ